MEYERAVDLIGRGVESAGILAIVVGGLLATARLPSDRLPGAYTRYRQSLGRALLLGLEFLVAADVIRTVATEPTFRNVGVLGLIVVIRTFLSFSLELEIEGRWPWQRSPNAERGMRNAE